MFDWNKWNADRLWLEKELKAHQKYRKEPPGRGPDLSYRKDATRLYAFRAHYFRRVHRKGDTLEEQAEFIQSLLERYTMEGEAKLAG